MPGTGRIRFDTKLLLMRIKIQMLNKMKSEKNFSIDPVFSATKTPGHKVSRRINA